MSPGDYASHRNFLYNEMDEHFTSLQKEPHKKVHKYSIDNGLAAPDDKGNISIDVTFDGSWLIRGHKS